MIGLSRCLPYLDMLYYHVVNEAKILVGTMILCSTKII